MRSHTSQQAKRSADKRRSHLKRGARSGLCTLVQRSLKRPPGCAFSLGHRAKATRHQAAREDTKTILLLCLFVPFRGHRKLGCGGTKRGSFRLTGSAEVTTLGQSMRLRHQCSSASICGSTSPVPTFLISTSPLPDSVSSEFSWFTCHFRSAGFALQRGRRRIGKRGGGACGVRQRKPARPVEPKDKTGCPTGRSPPT